MKLSKSKLALAKVINENGGWVDGTMQLATSNKNGSVYLWSNTPRRIRHVWDFGGRFTALRGDWRKLPNWHQTILSREEYYQAYPKADADGWIEWKGGECPVGDGVLIDVKKVDGSTEFAVHDPQDRIWGDTDHRKCIIAYRLHKPEVKPEFCESVMRSIPEPGAEAAKYLLAKNLGVVGDAIFDSIVVPVTGENRHQHVDANPTIEQLAHDYRNAKDYALRLQKDAGEAAVKAESFAVEIRKKILELQELIG